MGDGTFIKRNVYLMPEEGGPPVVWGRWGKLAVAGSYRWTLAHGIAIVWMWQSQRLGRSKVASRQ